ncbi:hypothetical protein BT93_B0277 [Corymbia citriodora subsp. variegata]|nr:hypothetical protein BT93_B0277 [Corymbia citriodora subsp. variegata]
MHKTNDAILVSSDRDVGHVTPAREDSLATLETDLVWKSSAKPRFHSLVGSQKVLSLIRAFVAIQASRTSMFLCCVR